MKKKIFVMVVVILAGIFLVLGKSWRENSLQDNLNKATEMSQGSAEESNSVDKRTGPMIIINDVNAQSGAKNVTVPLLVKNNPGILGMTFSVSYDESVMTMENAEIGEAVKDVLELTTSKQLSSGCTFVFDGIEISGEEIQDGTIVEMTFRLKENAAAGRYPITLLYDDDSFVDNDLKSVNILVQNGYVTIGS